jgi:hypothetical protein
MRLRRALRATMPLTMKRTALASALTRHAHPMALMLGLLLGQIVALMAQRNAAGWAGFGISTVLVAAASASFVMAVLGLRQERQPLPPPVLSRQARGLAIVIGLGLVLSLNLPG